jgi:hypothetical protein
MEPRHLEGHLTGAGSVTRRSPRDDRIRLRQTDHRRNLIYIRMPAPPWRYSTPVTQQRGVRGTLFVLLRGAHPRASIELFESVKKATGLRVIRETIGLECDKSEAHLERVEPKACSVPTQVPRAAIGNRAAQRFHFLQLADWVHAWRGKAADCRKFFSNGGHQHGCAFVLEATRPTSHSFRVQL